MVTLDIKVVAWLHNQMTLMTEQERKQVIDELLEGFCPHCYGSFIPCYCTKDD